MTEPEKIISESFQQLEKMAKDRSIPLADLTHNLALFLQKTNYNRTGYDMHFFGVYRARSQSFESIDKACEEYGHINNLRYPPDDFARECRCNAQNTPVFYCSSDGGVPIFEVRPEIGDYVVVTRFLPKNRKSADLTVPIIGVTQLVNSIGSMDPQDQLVALLKKDMHYKSDDPVSLIIDAAIAEWFVEPVTKENSYIYRLTTAFFNAFTDYIKYDDEKVSSLIYPSVESNISGFNLVMQPHVYDEQLMVSDATIYQLERKVGKTYYLRPHKEIDTIQLDGSISWKRSALAHSMYILDPSDLSPKVDVTRIVFNK